MYVSDLGMYYVHGRWWRTDLGIFISPAEESGEYRYGSGQDGINEVWAAFSYGFNCQFYPDLAAGLVPYRSASGWSCEELAYVYSDEGNTFYVGQYVGRVTSSTVAALELFGGGAAVVGGGGMAIGTAGIAAIPGVAIAGAGVVVGVHGGGVQWHNLQHPPVMLANGNSDPRSPDRLNQILRDRGLFLNWIKANYSESRIGSPLSDDEASFLVAIARKLGIKIEANMAGLQGLERTGKWAGIPHFKIGPIHIPIRLGFVP